jgi:hypothetical protein
MRLGSKRERRAREGTSDIGDTPYFCLRAFPVDQVQKVVEEYCGGLHIPGPATTRLGHFWKAQVGQF